MKRKPLLRSLLIATSIFIAGHFMTCSGAAGVIQALTGNYNLMATEVQAAELDIFTGEWVYVQNEIGAPEAAVIKTGDAIAVAIFKDTMIQLKSIAGITPNITLGAEVAAVAPAPTGDGILIAGNQLGEGLIQVQNPVNGSIANVVVSVLDSGLGTAPAVTAPTTQAVICNHPGVVNGFYSYADNHKVVSADGALELHLDNLVWKSDVGHAAPKIYFAADGILTVEAYMSQAIKFPYKCNLPGYYYENDFLGKDGYMFIGGADTKRSEKIEYFTIQRGGAGEDKVKNEATQLPVRIITLGGRYDGDAYLWGGANADILRPISFPAK